MTTEIAHVQGDLILKIGDAEAVSLGWVRIPITVRPGLNANGSLVLTAEPNMAEVRATIQAIFNQSEGAQ